MSTGPAIRLGTDWFPLFRVVTVVGRRSQDGGSAPDIDLTEWDRGRTTSRQHAELRCRGGVVHVHDLGSTNGTRVNDTAVTGDHPVRLRDGDRLSFAGLDAAFAQQAPWPDDLVPEPAAAPDADARAVAMDATMLGPRPVVEPPARLSLWRRLLRRPAR